MRFQREVIAGDVTWLVKGRNLTDERHLKRLARCVAPSELVYVPPDEVIERKALPALPLHADEHEPVKPSRPDPERVAPIRVALRARGMELEPCGPFYWRVVPR